MAPRNASHSNHTNTGGINNRKKQADDAEENPPLQEVYDDDDDESMEIVFDDEEEEEVQAIPEVKKDDEEEENGKETLEMSVSERRQKRFAERRRRQQQESGDKDCGRRDQRPRSPTRRATTKEPDASAPPTAPTRRGTVFAPEEEEDLEGEEGTEDVLTDIPPPPSSSSPENSKGGGKIPTANNTKRPSITTIPPNLPIKKKTSKSGTPLELLMDDSSKSNNNNNNNNVNDNNNNNNSISNLDCLDMMTSKNNINDDNYSCLLSTMDQSLNSMNPSSHHNHQRRRGRGGGGDQPLDSYGSAHTPNTAVSAATVNTENYFQNQYQVELLKQFEDKLTTNQEQTLKALQDLTQTLTTLMMQQIKRSKESDEDAKDILEVDRATVRLDGLEVYAVVSALTVATAIACFDVYGSNHENIFTADQLNRNNLVSLILNTIFLAVSGVGIIAGLHATLVFSLMTMYGRTAVGVSHDEAFVEFFVQTGRVRYRGFHTFRLSLYCFLIQVLFTITSKCSPILRPIVLFLNLASMWWVYHDTQSVIDKAGDILFNFNKNKQSNSSGGNHGGGTKRKNSAGKYKLEKTLSDMSDPDQQRDSQAIVLKGLQAMRNRVRRSGSGGDVNSDDSTGSCADNNIKKRGGAGRSLSPTREKKTPARSKSGMVIYDVGPQAQRAVRRGGRRPGRTTKDQ